MEKTQQRIKGLDIKMSNDLIQSFVGVLESLGIDLEDPNFADTPRRMAKLYMNELCYGLGPSAEKEIESLLKVTFPTKNSDMVVIKNHRCFGLCPHHFLPVAYTISVGYIPSDKAVGLSKLPRIIDLIAAKPMLQEDLGNEILKAIEDHLTADAMVVIKGYHSCMSIRGVRSRDAQTITAALNGEFQEADVKAEFYQLLTLPD